MRLGTALPRWTGLKLGERLSRSFRCPVLVENDAKRGGRGRALEGRGDRDGRRGVGAGRAEPGGRFADRRAAAPGLRRGGRGDRRAAPAGQEATPEALLSTTDEPLHPLDEQAVAEVFALARKGDSRARGGPSERFIQRLVHDVAAWCWRALDPGPGGDRGLGGPRRRPGALRRELATLPAVAAEWRCPCWARRPSPRGAAPGPGPCGGAAVRRGRLGDRAKVAAHRPPPTGHRPPTTARRRPGPPAHASADHQRATCPSRPAPVLGSLALRAHRYGRGLRSAR